MLEWLRKAWKVCFTPCSVVVSPSCTTTWKYYIFIWRPYRSAEALCHDCSSLDTLRRRWMIDYCPPSMPEVLTTPSTPGILILRDGVIMKVLYASRLPAQSHETGYLRVSVCSQIIGSILDAIMIRHYEVILLTSYHDNSPYRGNPVCAFGFRPLVTASTIGGYF